MLGWLNTSAAESAVRAAPTRPDAAGAIQASPPPAAATTKPAPAPTKVKKPEPAPRFPAPEWVDVTVAAKRLGLKVEWKVAGREAVLTDRDTRLEVASDRIEVELNGDRIFLGQALLSRGGDLFVSKIDLDRCLVPLVRPELIVGRKPKPKTIVIDPGHGGPDTGKVNESLKLYEKTYTLDTSLRLKKILETRGWKVVLTRTDDRQLKPSKQDDLQRRAQIADDADADVFVSIHFNAVAEQVEKVSGAEVYRFTPRHQPPVTRAQRRLDDEMLNHGNGNDAWNSLLAYSIQRRLLTEMKLDDRGFKHDRLAVLRLVSCPAVLVEGGFLSNTAEARKIATAAYRQQLAEAMANGIVAYATQVENLARGSKPPTE
jgi:N-acetylmuramoyl-L-alanine amidase